MKTSLLAVSLAVFAAGIAAAQGNRVVFVRAVGDGTVTVQPDQAKISLAVVTQAPTAQDASGQNQNLINSVLNQLKGLLGPNADIRTIGYSLSSTYSYPQGQPPVLTGYTASNTVQVTTTDLTIVGRVIDTGVAAGANQVSGLQFGLKDDTAARSQALKLASASARTHADAMASGVGMHTGAVLDIQEGVSVTPVQQPVLGAATSATPVQSGSISVSATVTIDVALVS